MPVFEWIFIEDRGSEGDINIQRKCGKQLGGGFGEDAQVRVMICMAVSLVLWFWMFVKDTFGPLDCHPVVWDFCSLLFGSKRWSSPVSVLRGKLPLCILCDLDITEWLKVTGNLYWLAVVLICSDSSSISHFNYGKKRIKMQLLWLNSWVRWTFKK